MILDDFVKGPGVIQIIATRSVCDQSPNMKATYMKSDNLIFPDTLSTKLYSGISHGSKCGIAYCRVKCSEVIDEQYNLLEHQQLLVRAHKSLKVDTKEGTLIE